MGCSGEGRWLKFLTTHVNQHLCQQLDQSVCGPQQAIIDKNSSCVRRKPVNPVGHVTTPLVAVLHWTPPRVGVKLLGVPLVTMNMGYLSYPSELQEFFLQHQVGDCPNGVGPVVGTRKLLLWSKLQPNMPTTIY